MSGTSTFSVQITDAAGGTATKSLTVTINAALAVATSSPMPVGQVGSTYNQSLSATGGVTPYSWSITTGSLPAGLSLDAGTGAITGTATTAGTSSFTAKVTDVAAGTATKSLSITITSAGVNITTTSLPNAQAGSSYSQTLAATGGRTPYTWAIISGSPPTGLTLNTSSGRISGTATGGSSTFTVQVTDSTNPTHLTDTQSLTITVTGGVNITTTSLPNAQAGTPIARPWVPPGAELPTPGPSSLGLCPPGSPLTPRAGESPAQRRVAVQPSPFR